MWGVGGREDHEGGSICIHIADSHCCTAETNNIAKQVYCNKNIFINVIKKKTGKVVPWPDLVPG